MDRTGKLILFGSVVILIASFFFQSKMASQRSAQRRDDANSTKQGTSPPPVISSLSNTVTQPLDTGGVEIGERQGPRRIIEEEKTPAVLNNEFVRYTFTKYGGGIKKVEMVERDSHGKFKYPKEIGKKGSDVGLVDMNLDRGRLPLLAFEPS